MYLCMNAKMDNFNYTLLNIKNNVGRKSIWSLKNLAAI